MDTKDEEKNMVMKVSELQNQICIGSFLKLWKRLGQSSLFIFSHQLIKTHHSLNLILLRQKDKL